MEDNFTVLEAVFEYNLSHCEFMSRYPTPIYGSLYSLHAAKKLGKTCEKIRIKVVKGGQSYIIRATYFQSLMSFKRISCAITRQNHEDVMRLRDLGLQQGINSIPLMLSEATMGKRTCSTCVVWQVWTIRL